MTADRPVRMVLVAAVADNGVIASGGALPWDIPEDTEHREVLLLIAFTVVAGTLLVQGLSLPWFVRHLDVPVADPLEDALARASLLQQASKAGFAALKEAETDVLRLSAHVDDVTQAGEGEVAEMMRPFYLDYLRRHNVTGP